jgi:hypothetical protein
MQNPLSFLFQELQSEKPLDAQVAKTCTKWDVAQGVMDDVHAELQAMPLNNAEDLPRFHRTLVDYAAYAMYAALMKRQLDQLMPGAGIDDYTAVLDKCYGKSPLNNVFREAINKEMDADMAPLREQLQVQLSISPSSWVQRVQQSKNPLQLVKDEGTAP